MNQIDNLTDQADQQTQVVLPDGSVLTLELTYYAATERWQMNVSHPLLTVNGLDICIHPNLLRQWRNLIPFGLSCTTTTGVDPVSVEDFVNGNAALYVLTAADVQGVEANVFGGALQ